jgi:hypothetical protein
MQINNFHAASTLATARLIMLSRYLSRAFSARSFPNYKQQIDIIYFERITNSTVGNPSMKAVANAADTDSDASIL